MAILLSTEKTSKVEAKHKFALRYPELHRNLGIIDEVDFINDINYRTTHDSVQIQICTKVNSYVMDNKVPQDTLIYIYDLSDLYVYDWKGGYLFEIPRVFRN